MTQTDIAGTEDFPWGNTIAAKMMRDALADRPDVSQRELARQMGYKSSVVISHMASGRAPIPPDRAREVAEILGIAPSAFVAAVFRQRFPDVDFEAVFGGPADRTNDSFAHELASVAGCTLDLLPAETKSLLREVVADRMPKRRWLSLAELAAVESLRSAIPGLREGTVRNLGEKISRLESALRAEDGGQAGPADSKSLRP
ncbi:helix-turn-helix domain-containing protein [Sphingomonas elodea]|uniref:helix-turn-helix domain-containing protein n=1 Tax=Sphingomonas elodea TaxID=179878 RepID=UPI0002630540|nr:helix-turn-helix transcriptional regulator [Sphingomonas elodea]